MRRKPEGESVPGIGERLDPTAVVVRPALGWWQPFDFPGPEATRTAVRTPRSRWLPAGQSLLAVVYLVQLVVDPDPLHAVLALLWGVIAWRNWVQTDRYAAAVAGEHGLSFGGWGVGWGRISGYDEPTGAVRFDPWLTGGDGSPKPSHQVTKDPEARRLLGEVILAHRPDLAPGAEVADPWAHVRTGRPRA